MIQECSEVFYSLQYTVTYPYDITVTHRSDWHQLWCLKLLISALTIMTFAFNVNNQLHNSFKFSQEKY